MDNVVQLAGELIKIPSVTRQSNAPIIDFIEHWLEPTGFQLERLDYEDENGTVKANLIAKLGQGKGGLALCSHSDTVPGQEEDWAAFDATIKDGRLYGRGSCDMKGPLAATLVAAANIDPAQLSRPLYVVITADEETGLFGAKHVSEHSEMLRTSKPQFGIIAEPTQLAPVYGHKGYARIYVTAYGEAAHTSTGKGISANFKIAPFMAEMAQLAEILMTDEAYMNHEFTPPTNGFNMIVNDGDCALNVTAAKTEVALAFRVMPNSRAEELLATIHDTAEKYGLKVHSNCEAPLYTDRDSALLKAASEATSISPPQTVAFGTDGIYLQACIEQLIVLGPGNIDVAHTVGESILVDELERAVDVYRQMIEQLCVNGA